MDRVRRNLRQRLKHKEPHVQSRVRHNQPRRMQNLIAVKQQIKINGARRVKFLNTAVTSQCLLDPQQLVQQRLRAQRCFQMGRRVHEPRRTSRRIHRLCFPKRCHLFDACARDFPDLRQRRTQGRLALSEVGTQCNICGRHGCEHRVIGTVAPSREII